MTLRSELPNFQLERWTVFAIRAALGRECCCRRNFAYLSDDRSCDGGVVGWRGNFRLTSASPLTRRRIKKSPSWPAVIGVMQAHVQCQWLDPRFAQTSPPHWRDSRRSSQHAPDTTAAATNTVILASHQTSLAQPHPQGKWREMNLDDGIWLLAACGG